MLKKLCLGLGLGLMLAFSFIIPTFASLDSEGEEDKAEGIIQSVDALTGSFTVLAEDGATVTVFAPEGFDLTLLVVGDHIEVEGTVGLDGLFAASELELQDGTEFEADDEVEEEEDEGEGEDDDDSGGDDSGDDESEEGDDD